MQNEIDKRLSDTASVTLLTDGWTGQFSNEEYWSVAAQFTNGSFDKEIVVLGMAELKKGHRAEEIKTAIETIVNEYKFDKRKIKGT
jgi:hypothetical protein